MQIELLKYMHSYAHFNVNRIKNAPNSKNAAIHTNTSYESEYDIVRRDPANALSVQCLYSHANKPDDLHITHSISLQKYPQENDYKVTLFEVDTTTSVINKKATLNTEIHIVYCVDNCLWKAIYDNNGSFITVEMVNTFPNPHLLYPEAQLSESIEAIPQKIDSFKTINSFIAQVNRDGNKNLCPTIFLPQFC